MFSVELLRELYRHMEWADAKVWQAVPRVPSVIDDKLRWWLVHIHVVQRAFLQVWTDRPIAHAFRTPESFAELEDVRKWARPYYAEAASFISALNDERLREKINLPWSDELTTAFGRAPARTSLGETCFQVTSHSTYHRGQVNARLRELGSEPPLVDYIAWIWFDRPAAEWRD